MNRGKLSYPKNNELPYILTMQLMRVQTLYTDDIVRGIVVPDKDLFRIVDTTRACLSTIRTRAHDIMRVADYDDILSIGQALITIEKKLDKAADYVILCAAPSGEKGGKLEPVHKIEAERRVCILLASAIQNMSILWYRLLWYRLP